MTLQDVQLNEERRMTLMIDFDGVIRDDSNGFQGGELKDEIPVKDAFATLARLHQSGYHIVVYTARARDYTLAQGMVNWIDKQMAASGFVTPYRITCEKEPARAYIDDRAVRFTNWADIEKLYR